MVNAPTVMAIGFSTRWQPIAPALVLPQLMLAGPTSPRGDGDGLWVLVFPMLIVGGMLLYVLTYTVASIARGRMARRQAAP
jgi:hypothetical protein